MMGNQLQRGTLAFRPTHGPAVNQVGKELPPSHTPRDPPDQGVWKRYHGDHEALSNPTIVTTGVDTS